MRPISFVEIFNEKCHMCGCKNKVHSNIVDKNNKIVGYSLKCCNCGRYIEFLDDREYNGSGERIYRLGEQTCISPGFCPFKDCKLYNKKYIPDDKKPDPKPIPPIKPKNKQDKTITEYIHNNRFL